jgi:nitrogen fixation protein NifX
MMQALSRELALRIGLAARVLPDTDARRLLAVLVECVGLPLTEDKLSGIKVKDLKTAANGEFAEMSMDALKAAVRFLKAEEDSVPKQAETPDIKPLQAGEMPNSIRVACASNTYDVIDGHFGSCARFLIYQVSKDEIRLIDVRSTECTVEVDDKNAFRTDLIKDCHVIYIASVGGPAAAKIVKASIHPIKHLDGGVAVDVLKQLQEVLHDAPPPWLAKVMGVSAEERARIILSEEDAA